MKFLIAFAVLVAVAAAAPSVDSEAHIVSEHSDSSPDGSYRYGYETSNGLQSTAEGEVKQNVARASPEDPESYITSRGSYSYTGEDGHVYKITWTADENGFHPEGEHLPVAPVA